MNVGDRVRVIDHPSIEGETGRVTEIWWGTHAAVLMDYTGHPEYFFEEELEVIE